MIRKSYPINKWTLTGVVSILLSFVVACSPVRHVPDGSLLLDKVKLTVIDSSAHQIDKEMLTAYLRQLPNHKLLWKVKMQLGIYNMSGKDSTKWYNKLARSLGEAPVIYDSLLTNQSELQLTRALVNMGYLHTKVDVDTTVRRNKKKIEVNYIISPGSLYKISSVSYNIPDRRLDSIIMLDTAMFIIAPGAPLDRTALELQRDLITSRLQNMGYYAFQKNYITFNADTTQGDVRVDLTMNVTVPDDEPRQRILPNADASRPWKVNNVTFVTDFDPVSMTDVRRFAVKDSLYYKGYVILYGDKQYLRPSVLVENCFIKPGEDWSSSAVSQTYDSFGRLGILKFVSVECVPISSSGDEQLLDVYVLLTPGRSQSIAVEIEGTNSEGDLGVAAALSYSHRNIGKGSETFSAKFRGAYESLSGKLEGFIHNRYMEYSLDFGLSFPKFKFPFLSESFKRKIKASTDFNIALNYQERPEYTRVIANAGWSYKWVERLHRTSHIFTPIDIDYVYLPKSTVNFIDEISPDNPLLRYSYEDHFIMRLGYSFYHTNKRPESPYSRYHLSDIYSIRAKGEMAGNLLFALSSIFNHRNDFRSDPYKIFGIHYAQYIKLEGDYSLTHIFDHRNSLAFHGGLGVAIPYGNSSVIPFEKRFYGGGANGVRGWDVRTLGPGSFKGSNSVTNFMNQCGDIRLDLSVEYRAKLFWVVELGAFIDIGNIWTIHNYPNQPGGMFHFNTFYKQLAAAYGLGLRLDFDYFLLRFDLGMKAHNPAEGEEPWPLIHPKWGRDRSIHFSVGYPF